MSAAHNNSQSQLDRDEELQAQLAKEYEEGLAEEPEGDPEEEPEEVPEEEVEEEVEEGLDEDDEEDPAEETANQEDMIKNPMKNLSTAELNMLGSYDRTNQKHSDPNYHTYRLNLMRRAHGLPKKPKYFFDPLGDDEEYQWLDDWSGPGGKPDIQTNEPMDGNGVNPRNTARARPFPSAGEPSTGEGHEVKDKWAYQKYTKPRRAPGDPTPSPSPPAEVVGIDDKGEKKPRRAQQVEEEEVPMAEDWREYESEEEDGEYEREEEGDEDEEMQSRKSEGSSDFQDPSDQDFGGSDVEVEGGEDEGEYVNDDDKGDDAPKRRKRGMKGGRRSRYAAAATGPITAANVPATPQAQNPGAHLLIDDILDAQEFQRRINLGLASPEGNEVLAGCNAFWLPVRRTSDIVPSNFDPVQQYALTQAQLDAITNRAYPFPHAIDSAEPENRTLYISGLDQVTEDNLPPIMANVLNVMPTNIPFLQDHQGNYLKSLRTGRCYKNFGNMVPNGVSTHEVGAFFGLYENLGAQLKDDMHDRVHRDAHIQPSSNHQRNLKNKWERDFGGIAATTKGPRGKDKSNASDHATGTMNRLNGQQAQTLHRVVWTVDATGQYMQQSRPRKIANTSATNYQGLWYTVPPAQNVDGMMLDFVNATTRYAPTLSSYLLTHPNAHVVGGAAPARAPPTAAPAVVAGPSAAAEADDSDAEEGAVGPSAALEEENSMMGEDEPVDSVMVDEQLSEEEYVGKGKGRSRR